MRFNYFRFGIGLACASTMFGCASVVPPVEINQSPAAIEATAFPAGHTPVALVLSGGAARGFAHIGVIRVLEKNGMRPDIVVGTSAGSIVGALYASGLTANELQIAMQQMDATVFSDFVMPGFGFLRGEMGFIRGDKLHRFIDARLKHHHIQDFPIRFAAVASDLSTGKPTAFNSGDAGWAVVASSAIPGIISPAEINGKRYSDGQMTSPLPNSISRELGAQIVIAIDVVYPPDDAVLYSPISILFKAFTISVYRLKEHELHQANLVITPDLGKHAGQLSFDDSDRLIAAGEAAARSALPQLTLLFKK